MAMSSKKVEEKAAVDHSGLEATVDVVAQVSRDVNGDPAQSKNYIVMVDDDAPEHVKDAAHNRAGEAQGAKNVDPNAKDEDAK